MRMAGFADGKRRRRFSSAEGRRYVPRTGTQQANSVEAVRKRKGNEAEILLEKRPRSGFFDNVRVCILKQDVGRDEGFARSVQHVPTATCWWDGDDGSRQHSSDFCMDEIQRPHSGFFDNVNFCILKQDEEFSRRWVNSVQPSVTCWWDGDDGSTKSSGGQHSSDFVMDEIQRPRVCILKQDVGSDEEFSRRWVNSVQPGATCWWDGDDGSTKSSGGLHSSDFFMDEIQRPCSGFLRVCSLKQDVGSDEEFSRCWVNSAQPSATCWLDGDDGSTKSSGGQYSSDFFMDEIQRPCSGFLRVCSLKQDIGSDEEFSRCWVNSAQPSATCWLDGDDGSTKSSGGQHSSDFFMDEIPLQRPRSGFFDNELDTGRDERFARRWAPPSVQQHVHDDPSDEGSTNCSGRQRSSVISMDEMRLAISKSMEDMERTQEKMRETQHEVRIAKRKVDRLWEEIEAATPLRRAHYQALVEAERSQASVW